VDDKILYDITKFTVLDYEEHLSAVLWFGGCNMRCPYCYNSDIVFAKEGNFDKDELFRFLKSRQRRLEAVVLSGGECTLYKKLPQLAREIKELGYKIKIDTNGTNPKMLKEMLKDNLLDFISLDYKAPSYKYQEITKHKNFTLFKESLIHFIENEANFEVRTTVHTDLLDENDINHIIKDLYDKGYKNSYYIQNYMHQEKILGTLKEQTTELDITKIKTDLIDVKFRNFKI